MARKVFISSDMSNDERLIDVAEVDPQAALIWPWIITAFDDWGRAIASPKRLKSSIFPMIETVSSEIVEKSLNLYQIHGLIQLYEADGKPYMCIPAEKWYKYQTHMNRTNRRPGKDKMKSDYPDPQDPPQTPTGISGEMRGPVPSPSPSPSLSPSFNSGSHSPVNAFGIYEREIGELTYSVSQKLIALEEDYSETWLKQAIEVAVFAGEKKMRYIEGTLKNWKKLDHPEPWTLEKEGGYGAKENRLQESGNQHGGTTPASESITGGAVGWLPGRYNRDDKIIQLPNVSG